MTRLESTTAASTCLPSPSSVAPDTADARVRSRFSPRGANAPSPGARARIVQLKNELRDRFERGERPQVADWVEIHDDLRAHHDWVVSLAYEEFCLREEYGERPDPDAFCERLAPWQDSLYSQLRYHDAFSRLVTPDERAYCFPRPGDRFLSFNLDMELGRGGSARVYLAEDRNLGGRRTALKISPDLGDEPAIQGSLDHPHIVAVTQVHADPESGLRGLCMPYWPGIPLTEVLRRIQPSLKKPRSAQVVWDVLGPASAEEEAIENQGRPGGWKDFPHGGTYEDAVAWIGLKIAEALDHAHGRGVLHRDIKPANVLLTRRGGPMLLDFNLSHAPDSPARANSAMRGGTLPYLSLEQLEAFQDDAKWGRLGPPSDLFALGEVLRQLLTGRSPAIPSPTLSPARAVSEMIDQRKLPATSVRKLNRHVSHALDAVLDRAAAVRPEDRYATARELAEDLRRVIDRRPLKHASNRSRGEKVGNWFRHHRKLVVTAAVVALIPGVLGARSLCVSELTRSAVAIRAAADQAGLPQDQRGLLLTQADNTARWALALNPSHVVATRIRADVASQQGRSHEAVELLSRTIAHLMHDQPGSRTLVLTLADRAFAHFQLAAAFWKEVDDVSDREPAAQAASRFLMAEADLNAMYKAASTAKIGLPRELTRRVELVLVQVPLYLGDEAAMRDAYADALPYYQLAKKRLGQYGLTQPETASPRSTALNLLPMIEQRIEYIQEQVNQIDH